MRERAEEGEVYVSEFGVQYHVIATWGDWAWVKLMAHGHSEPSEWVEPRTMHRERFGHLRYAAHLSTPRAV